MRCTASLSPTSNASPCASPRPPSRRSSLTRAPPLEVACVPRAPCTTRAPARASALASACPRPAARPRHQHACVSVMFHRDLHAPQHGTGRSRIVASGDNALEGCYLVGMDDVATRLGRNMRTLREAPRADAGADGEARGPAARDVGEPRVRRGEPDARGARPRRDRVPGHASRSSSRRRARRRATTRGRRCRRSCAARSRSGSSCPIRSPAWRSIASSSRRSAKMTGVPAHAGHARVPHVRDGRDRPRRLGRGVPARAGRRGRVPRRPAPLVRQPRARRRSPIRSSSSRAADSSSVDGAHVGTRLVLLRPRDERLRHHETERDDLRGKRRARCTSRQARDHSAADSAQMSATDHALPTR